MAETYSFLECYIYMVGSKAGDTNEYSADAYGEDINVTVSRDLGERVDTEGVIREMIPLKTSVEMSIGKMYSAKPFFFDGNNIKLYMMNSLGTEKWQMTSCYWNSEEYSASADDVVAYNVTLTGASYGTVS